jgi:hypothetical protein
MMLLLECLTPCYCCAVLKGLLGRSLLNRSSIMQENRLDSFPRALDAASLLFALIP